MDGFGAEKFGGRWNSKGTALVYTSQSRALAMAEVAVHLPYGILPNDFSIVEIELEDRINIKEITSKDLPKNWNDIPHNNRTQLIGDKFVENDDFVALKVPSVIVLGDFNFLLNPKHKDFSKVKIVNVEPFLFDKRFIKN